MSQANEAIIGKVNGLIKSLKENNANINKGIIAKLTTILIANATVKNINNCFQPILNFIADSTTDIAQFIKLLPEIAKFTISFPSHSKHFINKTLSTCDIVLQQIQKNKANPAPYAIVYQARLIFLANKRNFDASIVSLEIKNNSIALYSILTKVSSKFFDLVDSPEELNLQLKLLSRSSVYLEQSLLWAKSHTSKIYIQDLMSLISLYSTFVGDIQYSSGKTNKVVQYVQSFVGIKITTVLLALVECVDNHIMKLSSFILRMCTSSLAHACSSWEWSLSTYKLLIALGKRIPFDLNTSTAISKAVFQDFDKNISLLIERSDETSHVCSEDIYPIVATLQGGLSVISAIFTSTTDMDQSILWHSFQSLVSSIINYNLHPADFRKHEPILVGRIYELQVSMYTLLYECLLASMGNSMMLSVCLKVWEKGVQSRNSSVKETCLRLLDQSSVFTHPSRPVTSNFKVSTAFMNPVNLFTIKSNHTLDVDGTGESAFIKTAPEFQSQQENPKNKAIVINKPIVNPVFEEPEPVKLKRKFLESSVLPIEEANIMQKKTKMDVAEKELLLVIEERKEEQKEYEDEIAFEIDSAGPDTDSE